MELGISSLGYVLDLGRSEKYNNLFELMMNASRTSLEFAENHNITVCELVLEPPEIIEIEKRSKFIELCNSFSKIKKQIHGPFLDLSLCSHNKWISEATINTYIESAKISNEINATTLTIHPGLANFLIKSICKYNYINLLAGVNEILEATMGLNAYICLENMPKMVKIFLNIEDFESFFNKLNRDDLFMTWDTSHSWTCDVEVQILWEKFHKLIKNIHLVDNDDKENDAHPALGSGNVDFEKIIEIVKYYNYEGALIVELSSAKDLPKSIEFINKFF